MSDFKFLVTTDNHLGYKQDDTHRRKDSFMAFAESLQLGRENDVDFILLGGDLFHVNRPSSVVEHKCIKIIRQHMSAQADKGVSFERVGGDFSHFERIKHANFEDPNLKVPYPILTIHGNHDDPTGPNAKSVCEKLATCGLLNYFGAVKMQSKEVLIEPIILRKKDIKLALYGMGFVPDGKLRAAFDRGDIRFAPPPEDTFNILVVHQNRVAHVKSKYLPDDIYPNFIHLLIRGHEHDAMSPSRWPESKVDGLVYQPGSTVATSISAQESAPKKVAVMSVKLNETQGDAISRYKLNYELIPLKCTRKIIVKDISQREIFDHIKSTDQRRKLTPIEYRSIFRKYVQQSVSDCLEEFRRCSKEQEVDADETIVDEDEDMAERADSTKRVAESSSVYGKLSRFSKPLLKVRLEYKNKAERFDELEISSKFFPSQVANKDIISFRKQKLVQSDDGSMENVTFAEDNNDDEDEPDEFEVVNLSEECKDTIETMIENYFNNKPESESLVALSLAEYTDAVRGSCEDGNVISRVLGKKKLQLLSQYKSVLTDEEIAASKFDNQDKVSRWFTNAFRNKSDLDGQDKKLEGDEDEGMEVIIFDEE